MPRLTSDALRKLDAMDSEAQEDFQVYDGNEPRGEEDNGSDGDSAAFDSDEERMDRLITPRELEEIESTGDAKAAHSGGGDGSSSSSAIQHSTSPLVRAAPPGGSSGGGVASVPRSETFERASRRFSSRIRVQGQLSGSGNSDEGTGPTIWYFAYGSNMNVAQLLTRIGSFSEKKLFYLPDHRLVFNKRVSLKPCRDRLHQDTQQLGFANVIPCPGDRVYGIAYHIHESQIQKMDRFEGVDGGHYYRKTMRCMSDASARSQECEVYFACPEATADGLLPTEGYLSHLLGGRGMLPPEYVQFLQCQPTAKRRVGR